MLAILLHPFLLGVVYPALALAILAYVLLPETDDTSYGVEAYKPTPVVLDDVTQEIPRIKPYQPQGYVKPCQAIIGDELERQMMARLIAFNFLQELGQEARRKNTLALCA